MAKDISRTLIIGLGGTGQTVIRDIKKRLLRRYGEIPKLVKFLSFDTDADEYQDTPFEYYWNGENRKTQKYNLQQEEFVKIARPGLEVLKDDANCQNLNFEQLESIYGLANGIGANGFRVMGRAHFLYNANTILQRLKNTVSDLKNAQLAENQQASGYHLANQNVSVYIIASLAGGTGSSAFMDISRLLQHAGIDVVPRGADTPTDRIFGMFFMPAFFATKPNTPNVKINTYVALSELDYVLGLNDSKRYPDGCLEKEEDLNVYAEARSYMPVRYSNVYLIDERTKKGNSHDFAQAAGYVGSFIAASIAADNQALDSSYSNSTHRLHTVDGKYQNYSGLGYCEIRFERQNLVKYLLNRQIGEILKAYKWGNASLDVDKVADRFIADNHLDEGVMSQEEGMEDTRSQLNELTDSIYTLNDKRFSTIVMGKVETGKDAATNIENNKVKYLNKITTEATEAVKGFALKKKQILSNLETLLKDAQCQTGFGYFPDLAKRLKASFTNMSLGLEDEKARHEEMLKKTEKELQKIKSNISSNTSTGFMGIGSKKEAQQGAIKSYSQYVESLGTEQKPTLMRLTLEIIRKEEAIKIYEALINLIDLFYKEEEIDLGGDRKTIQITGSSLDVQRTYDALKGEVDSENSRYQPSKAAKNETIFADAYFKEYFETHPTTAFTLSEQSMVELEKTISKFFEENAPVNTEAIARLRENVLSMLPEDALIKKIKDDRLSMDELFIYCFGKADSIEDSRNLSLYPQLGLFKQLDTLFDSLWQYNDFRGPDMQPVALQCVVGVFDKENHLFNEINGYKQFIPSNHSYQYINVGDPDKIVFMLQETAIPAFKMGEAEVWANEYKARKGATYSFTDKRLEEIDLIMPEKSSETGEIAWAYGWMFGLLASVAGKIRVKPSGSYLTKNNAVLGNDGYYNYFGIHTQKPSDLNTCHRKFIKDEELFTDIYNQVMGRLETDKTGSIIRITHWVNDGELWANRGKLQTSMDEQERLVIQNEPLFLAKRFARLNSNAVSIRYDDSTRKIVCSDALGVLTEAEKVYQESKTGKA